MSPLSVRRATARMSALVVGLALALVVSACGPSPSSPSAQAPAEDELVIYSGRNKNLVDPLLQDFYKQSGIKIFVRYGDSAELAAQLGEEGERTKADVFFSQDAGALGALGKAGRLDPLPSSVLDKVEPRYRATDGTWVGTSARSRVLAYDPRQVPPAAVPKSVFDLTDAKWKGKVGFAPTNASFQAFVTGMRKLAGEQKTRAWLQGMKANGMRSYDNNVRILDAVDRGEISLGLINHYYWYEKAAEVGKDKLNARLAFLGRGDPGALVNVAGVAVLKGTDKGDAAGRFTDFLLSRQAQQYFADKTQEYPLLAGVPANRDLPPLQKLGAPDLDLATLDDLQRTLQLMEEVGLS